MNKHFKKVVFILLLILVICGTTACSSTKNFTNKDPEYISERTSNAEFWLERARDNAAKDSVSMEIDFMNKHLEKAEKSLGDINTNNEEIKELLVKGYVSKAKFWLEKARKNSAIGDVSYEINSTRNSLARAGKSLKYIETSVKETEELIITGYISSAISSLNQAREHAKTDSVAMEINSIRCYLEKAEKSLEDIGTDDTEIEELLASGYMSNARSLLKYIRKTATNENVYIEVYFMNSHLEKAGKNLEDIGTRRHTYNPVPVLLWGALARREPRIRSILDIAPLLLDAASRR